jgi:vacuolar-type H+-ATPase subunit I/STV1
MIPIKDNKGYYRDEKTNAILNWNDNQYREYIRIKNKKHSDSEELNKIKKDIEEIKSALKTIVESINK